MCSGYSRLQTRRQNKYRMPYTMFKYSFNDLIIFIAVCESDLDHSQGLWNLHVKGMRRISFTLSKNQTDTNGNYPVQTEHKWMFYWISFCMGDQLHRSDAFCMLVHTDVFCVYWLKSGLS